MLTVTYITALLFQSTTGKGYTGKRCGGKGGVGWGLGGGAYASEGDNIIHLPGF